jgi:hypothetical protein
MAASSSYPTDRDSESPETPDSTPAGEIGHTDGLALLGEYSATIERCGCAVRWP